MMQRTTRIASLLGCSFPIFARIGSETNRKRLRLPKIQCRSREGKIETASETLH
jgi:hypothetical protein